MKAFKKSAKSTRSSFTSSTSSSSSLYWSICCKPLETLLQCTVAIRLCAPISVRLHAVICYMAKCYIYGGCFAHLDCSLAIVFDAYAALQEVKHQAPSFPYRYSFLQEELCQLQRGKYTRFFACTCRGRVPAKDRFFLSTEDIASLLEDPETLGAERQQRQVAAQERKVEHFHHVQAKQRLETVITCDLD